MKKVIILTLVFALVFGISGTFAGFTPPSANASIGTSLTRDDAGAGASRPIIKAKWEMKGPCFSGSTWNNCSTVGEGEDALGDEYAQFNAPGVWDDVMNYTVCAIVTDPNGVGTINGVYADIYYPASVAFHPESNTPYNDKINGGPLTPTDPGPDYGKSGCGAFIEENTLKPLSMSDGYDLFCNHINGSNNNLPTFYGGYNYNDICGDGTNEGQLVKQTAKVYCDDKTLKWEDPAGNYKVEVFAIDSSGNFSYTTSPDYNHFTYRETLGFQVDFDAVDYGTVALSNPGDEHKKIAGDLTWDTMAGVAGTNDNPASVRNIGNVRLNMLVKQNDMGLGQSSGQWNVEYDARVGANEADWKKYSPSSTTFAELEDILDLSQLEEMDFSILVTKFPSIATNYTGVMDLDAEKAEFRQCGHQ